MRWCCGACLGEDLDHVEFKWLETTLGECVVINDSTYSSKENWQRVNYLDTGNITENRIDSVQEIDVANQKLPTRARRKVKPGDVVYSTVRPNQRHHGVIDDPPSNFLASTGFAVLRGIEGIADTEFIYWHLAQGPHCRVPSRDRRKQHFSVPVDQTVRSRATDVEAPSPARATPHRSHSWDVG